MSKPMFRKVVIVGLGLIGGSLGMALRKRRLAGKITGVPRAVRGSRHMALIRAAVDDVCVEKSRMTAVLNEADLVVLAMPVLANSEWIRRNAKHIGPKTVVIDVGSTKADIERVAARSLGKRSFVGCHPMAGSEKTGIEHSRADLFLDANCFITAANAKVEELWKRVGARPVRMTASEHDSWVAKTSHLPHVLAFILLRLAGNASEGAILGSIGYLNPSFKSSARLAKSNAGLWADIFWSNRTELLKCVSEFEEGLNSFKKALKDTDVVRAQQNFLRLIKVANYNANLLMPDEQGHNSH